MDFFCICPREKCYYRQWTWPKNNCALFFFYSRTCLCCKWYIDLVWEAFYKVSWGNVCLELTIALARSSAISVTQPLQVAAWEQTGMVSSKRRSR